jgi:hypothetical protein
MKEGAHHHLMNMKLMEMMKKVVANGLWSCSIANSRTSHGVNIVMKLHYWMGDLKFHLVATTLMGGLERLDKSGSNDDGRMQVGSHAGRGGQEE